MNYFNNFHQGFYSYQKYNYLNSVNFIGNFRKIYSTNNIKGYYGFASGSQSIKGLDISNLCFTSSNMGELFANSSNIYLIKTNNQGKAAPTNLEKAFDNIKALPYVNVSLGNTSQLTNLFRIFNDCTSIEKITGLKFGNTRNVNNFASAFMGCQALKDLSEVQNGDTSNGYNFSKMFGCGWTSGNNGCRNLRNLNLSNGNMQKATTISGMFSGCENLIDLQGLDKGKLTNITKLDLGSFFSICENLKNIHLLLSNGNKPINVLTQTFINCKRLNNSSFLENGDINNVNNLNSTFSYCTNLISLNLSKGNTSNVYNFMLLFSGSNNLKTLNISNGNVSNGKDFSGIFSNCSNLINIDIANGNVSSGNRLTDMFAYCSNLTALNISNGNVSNCQYFNGMFRSCYNLTTLNISNGNTCNSVSFAEMFAYCNHLTVLNLSNGNTSSVKNMWNMFYVCNKMQTLNLANWDIRNCDNMSEMFRSCSNLNYLYLNNCDFSHNPILTNAFYNIPSYCNIWVRDSYAKSLILNSRADLTNVKVSTNLGGSLEDTVSYKCMNTQTITKTIEYYGSYVDDHPNNFSVSISPTSTTQFNASATIDKTNCKITLTITGKAEGTNNITLTLQDTQGHSISQQIPITITPYIPQHYEVQNLSTTYTFVENSNGYYESNNKGIDNSFAICKLVFVSGTGNLILDCINYAESSYDFGILSKIDTTLNLDANTDTTNVYKSFKGLSKSGIQTITYSGLNNSEHFIYIKYRKDGSASTNNDSLQFKVRFN